MKLLGIFFLIYLLTVNIFAFALMGIDKKRAVRGAWRIPEATLFLYAAIGGSLGSILGMHVFHHKTKRRRFVRGMPLLLLLQLVLAALIGFILFSLSGQSRF